VVDAIEDLLADAPLLALFLCVSLGYLIGKLRIGSFQLGGIAGTLIVGVVIGQFDVTISDDLKTIFFALFIYAVGYQGGPQFVRALNRRSLNELASAFTMAFVGLLVVLACAFAFDLDRGTAAGLGAGGLTQSAIIGTADEAIGELDDVSSKQIKDMQTNVAVGYAITYIFGQIGPILAITWLFPLWTKWDIRREAKAKAERMSGGEPVLEPGELDAVDRVQTRFFAVSEDGDVVGTTVGEIDAQLAEGAVEIVNREGTSMDPADDLEIAAGDTVAITGFVRALEAAADRFGTEVVAPAGLHLIEEERDVVVTSGQVAGLTFGKLRDDLDEEVRRGAFPNKLVRAGHEMPILSDVELQRGDELTLLGRPSDLDRVEPLVGYSVSAAKVTDFVFFGFGMALGVAIGLLTVTIGGVPITLGTGGGCLVSGLLFGWLRSTHPRYAALPVGASNFLRDFGLAVFVGVVGLTAGPQAIDSLADNGVELFFLGIVVTMLPMLIVFPISYYAFRIKDPIDSLACVAGGRSANPGFASLLERAGNATPVAAFTITYALANVLLTVWGPLIVGLVDTNT
jgi:aspartate-alanine antiporter